MSSLSLRLHGSSGAFAPGQQLEGEAEWELAEPVDSLDLRLTWSTEGELGSEEPVVVATETIKHPQKRGTRAFRFALPAGPWSFVGQLFSLTWWVELVPESGGSERADFVLSPTGAPLRTRPPEEAPGAPQDSGPTSPQGPARG